MLMSLLWKCCDAAKLAASSRLFGKLGYLAWVVVHELDESADIHTLLLNWVGGRSVVC